MKRSVRLSAFAKVNLRLHVLGRLPDGYHELRTIFQSISLHDTLELQWANGKGITLHADDPSLPNDSSNLVWRAIDALRHELHLRAGVHARLVKRIPVARGLGGGSSDAAASLLGMMRLAQRQVPFPRLMEIAADLGADVPFFLFGGRALGVHRGDEIYPLPDAPRSTILVVSPRDIGVSTRDAYAWMDQCKKTRSRLTKQPSAVSIWGFCALCWSRQSTGVSNDFETAVFRRHPRLAQIKRALLRGGAAEAALAGSGSAVFGVFRNPAQARRSAREFPQDRVFVAKTLSRKEHLRGMLAPKRDLEDHFG